MNKPETFTESNSVQGDYSMFAIRVPKTVGFWIPVEGTKIGVFKMPNKFHQWTMKLAFGWKFEAEAVSTTTQQLLKG